MTSRDDLTSPWAYTSAPRRWFTFEALGFLLQLAGGDDLERVAVGPWSGGEAQVALRSSHGRAAELGAVLTSEVRPPDEQQMPRPEVAVPLAAGRDGKGRVRTSEAAKALASLPRRGAFLPRRIACDPRFEPHAKRRLQWLKARRAELCEMTGGVSHSVGAMLVMAAWMYAGAEFAAEMGAERGDLELFRTSSTLSATARTHDMAALEIAVRESAVRKVATRNGRPAWLPASMAEGTSK